jgi:hypothetical protein
MTTPEPSIGPEIVTVHSHIAELTNQMRPTCDELYFLPNFARAFLRLARICRLQLMRGILRWLRIMRKAR